jgi:hypothetical protein
MHRPLRFVTFLAPNSLPLFTFLARHAAGNSVGLLNCLADQLRIIDSLSPSTVQPVVVSRRLPEKLRGDLQALLLDVANNPAA